ncbi:hypothetical protein BDZ97DRAFT_1827826 [Flammula alnicola]|nr:hypothetical protein BDZ97DRAFT_1827826 [Flammula alnicola]
MAISYQAAPVSRNPWTMRSVGNTSTTPPDHTNTGGANSSSTHARAVQHHSHHTAKFESTGRGGVGNIVYERSFRRHRT